MAEDLFTLEELSEIVREAEKPIYSEPNLIHLGTNKTCIRGVSAMNGLIMAYGNADTGFAHIYERHSLASRMPYWDDSGEIGNPTKFMLSFVPIDYLYVASAIFKESNLSIEKNKHPTKFDLFIGTFKHRRGRVIEYRLIVYKDTKVMHTFFVNKSGKPFNKKKILNLQQGWLSGKREIFTNIQSFWFSYVDIDKNDHFKIIIRYFESIKKEKWYIQVNPFDDRPYVTTFIEERDSMNSDQFMVNLVNYEFENVTWIEKYVKSICDNTYKF